MFPLELKFEAGATAAVVPQFVQMLDGMAEQVRIWVAESKTYGHNNSFADPAFGTDIAPRSETEWAPPVDIPLVEQPIEAEAVPSRNAELATVVDIPFAEPAIEPEVAPGSKTELEPLAAARNPHLYNSKHPIYGVSLFTLEPDSEAETTIITAPQSVAIKHPIAAVGLTIALAFLVSTGIFAYVSASRAGDLLFDWGRKNVGRSFFATNSARPCAAGEIRARFFKVTSAVANLKNLQQGITKLDTRVMNS